MKLWMSGEIEADVAEAYRTVRRDVEAVVNKELEAAADSGLPYDSWSVIAIIRSVDSPDYAEVQRKHPRRKVLEFRLKIDHGMFLQRDQRGRQRLVLDMLERSTTLMADLAVPPVQIAAARDALSRAADKLAG